MTKRRTVIDPNNGITAAEVSEAGRVLQEGISPPANTAVPEEQGAAPFTVDEWKPGVWVWRCTLCPWDTVRGEAAMWEHLRERHLPQPERIPARVLPLVDRFGNPLTA